MRAIEFSAWTAEHMRSDISVSLPSAEAAEAVLVQPQVPRAAQ
jgi:hypothetical protein